MYGTPRHSVSNQYGKTGKTAEGVNKDLKMYNAIFGTATRKEIVENQKEIFYEEIRRLDN